MAALLTACGGGGSDSGPTTTPATAAAPTITAGPASAASSSGETVTFTVQATGAGALTYQWRRDGADVPGATLGSLQVQPVTTADSGSQWSVKVCNADACTTSAPAALTVALKGVEFPAAASGLKPIGIGASQEGGLFLTNSTGVYKLNANGTAANDGKPLITQETAWAIAAGDAGSAYVTHFNPNDFNFGFGKLSRYVDRVTPAGESTLVAGLPGDYSKTDTSPLLGVDGAASAATFLGPFAVARDTQGNTYVTDA